MSTLTNSIVRGFGLTLGRKAANAVTSPRQRRVVTTEPTLSQKQLSLIQDVEKIKATYIDIQKQADDSYNNGRMSLTEYETIKVQVQEGIVEADAKIQSLSGVTEKKGSVWPMVIGVFLGIFVFLPMLLALVSALFR